MSFMKPETEHRIKVFLLLLTIVIWAVAIASILYRVFDPFFEAIGWYVCRS